VKLLLDTHPFIWWTTDPPKLSGAARDALANPENEVLLSVVSIWEIQIKKQLGKITLARPLHELVAEEEQSNAVWLLPVLAEHVYALEALPPHHKDPFDRLLLAQAQHEGAVLVSCDHAFGAYGAALLW